MFLLTLAIVDDIGAIPVTAIFYASSISFGWLAAAAAIAAVVLLRRVKVVHQLVASVGVSSRVRTTTASTSASAI